jgi:hypothetical protein
MMKLMLGAIGLIEETIDKIVTIADQVRDLQQRVRKLEKIVGG